MQKAVLKGRAFEAAGLLGVMMSLGFVGMEIRQNTVAVRAATIQAVSDQAMQITLTQAANEHLSLLVYRMEYEGALGQDFTPGDRQQLTTLVVAGFRRMENLFLQVHEGILDKSALKRVSIRFYRTPFGRRLWASARADYDPGFAAYWDEVISED